MTMNNTNFFGIRPLYELGLHNVSGTGSTPVFRRGSVVRTKVFYLFFHNRDSNLQTSCVYSSLGMLTP